MDSSAFDYLLKVLKDQRDSMVAGLGAGRIRNMEEYRDIWGFVRGLDFTVSRIDEILKESEESDE